MADATTNEASLADLIANVSRLTRAFDATGEARDDEFERTGGPSEEVRRIDREGERLGRQLDEAFDRMMTAEPSSLDQVRERADFLLGPDCVVWRTDLDSWALAFIRSQASDEGRRKFDADLAELQSAGACGAHP